MEVELKPNLITPNLNKGEQPKSKSRRQRWIKHFQLLGCAVGVIVAVLIVLALNPRIIGSVVAGRMGETAGGTVTLDSFEWTGWNSAEIKGAHLIAPDWIGAGSEILIIDRLQIELEMFSLLWGPTTIRNLQIDGIQVNVVEDPRRGSIYNFQSLRRGVTIAPNENLALIERAAMRDVRISFQRIKANKAIEILKVLVKADLSPSPIDPFQSVVDIRQVDGAIHLKGWWNQQTLAFDVSAEGMRVNENLGFVMPRTLRTLVEQADASGTVTSATLSASPGKPLHGKMEIADFQATLPIDSFDSWVRYENGKISKALGFPQIKLQTGTIELTGTLLEFRDLNFELVNTSLDARVTSLPVRASLNLDFDALLTKEFDWEDRAKWAQQIRDFAPFDLKVFVPDFSLGLNKENAAIEVPRSVADIFETFGAREVKSSAHLTATRATPTESADGTLMAQPIVVLGQLDISDGSGAFEDFKYPLRKIQSVIRFSGQDAHIEDLHGFGPDGQNVVLTGDVTKMGPTAGVNLTVTAESLPIDPTLFSSFPKQEGDLLASLFWTEGFQSLQAAGALFDQAQVTDAAAELIVIENRLAVLTTSSDQGTSQEISQMAIRAGQLRRIIDHGSFTPGGRLALTLKITRPENSTADAAVTGSIRILNANILTSIFPYPVRAKSGEIVLHEDRIDFGDGIPFETFDGAKGMFKGRVDIDNSKGLRTLNPKLEFVLKDDALSQLFFMAFPPSSNESVAGWPGKGLSKGGTILSQLDPRGSISLEGMIKLSKSGTLDVACDVTFQNGSIQPEIPAEKLIDSEGLFWPVGFGLDDCSGKFRVADASVVMQSFTGFRRDGRLDASGMFSMDGKSTDITIHLDNIQLAEYAINLIPFGNHARAVALWDRYKPTGQFDADISLKTPNGDGEIDTTLTVTPRSFGITLPEGPLQAVFESGTLTVADQHIRCDALLGTIGAIGGIPSQICFDGSYGTNTGGLDLHGSIENGLIHGPLIGEIVQQIDTGGLTSFLNEFKPEGLYDAQISYSIAVGAKTPSFELDAWIHQLTLGNTAKRLAIGFAVPAHINARGDSLEVFPFRGVFPGGSIEASGWLAANDNGTIDDGEFLLDLHAMGTGESVICALPLAARGPLSTIGFECQDILSANMQLRLSRPKDIAHIDIDTNVQIYGASIQIGTYLSNFSADLMMHIATDAKATSFDSNVTNGNFTLAGRKVRDVSATLLKPTESSEFFIKSFRGMLGTGILSANAEVETIEPFHYATDILLASVPLHSLKIPGEGVAIPNQKTAKSTVEIDPGLVDARINISGTSAGISTRQGRGSASIRQAELARLPIGVALLQITQLSLSLDPIVQQGEFDFTIDQDRIQFERFDLACKDLLLTGEGWLNTESNEIALRLRNRGTMPIISDILGGMTNQLFQIDVRGTITDPIGSLAPLPGLTAPPELPPSAPIASSQP
jgi:hypothetical protein